MCIFELEGFKDQSATQTIIARIGDNELLNQNIRLDFKGSKRHRSIFNLNGLAITVPGNLEFICKIDGNVVSTYDIAVKYNMVDVSAKTQ